MIKMTNRKKTVRRQSFLVGSHSIKILFYLSHPLSIFGGNDLDLFPRAKAFVIHHIVDVHNGNGVVRIKLDFIVTLADSCASASQSVSVRITPVRSEASSPSSNLVV